MQAWAGRTFPQGTTDCDKWVAANAFWHDLRKHFDDAQILKAAFLFFFADEDYKGDGKAWKYMNKGGEDEDEDKGGRGSSLVGEFAEKKTRTTVFPLSEREKEIAERLNGKVLEDR